MQASDIGWDLMLTTTAVPAHLLRHDGLVDLLQVGQILRVVAEEDVGALQVLRQVPGVRDGRLLHHAEDAVRRVPGDEDAVEGALPAAIPVGGTHRCRRDDQAHRVQAAAAAAAAAAAGLAAARGCRGRGSSGGGRGGGGGTTAAAASAWAAASRRGGSAAATAAAAFFL